MKIIYFVENGKMSTDDFIIVDGLRKNQNKVYVSNGSIGWGFEDSCGAVFLSKDFPHIESWAVSKGIEVMKPEPVVVAGDRPEPEPEPKPKRAGRPKTTPSE